MTLGTEQPGGSAAPGRETETTARWGADSIPDLAGRTIVVTGANSGLGFHTAAGLAARGARVIMACRDRGRGAAALDAVRRASGADQVQMEQLDLADLASVERFAKELLSRHHGVDALINNAGVMATPHRRTAQGFELQLGTNHLGHFALTGLLMPALLARPDARVVTVSSIVHRLGRIDFEDLQSERRYRSWGAYAQSKLANLLFAFELERRCAAHGVDLHSVAVHPGYSATNLQRASGSWVARTLVGGVYGLGNLLIAQPDAQGALPSLYAATVSGLAGGEFFGPDGALELRGHPRGTVASSRAYDQDSARRLWEVSEDLTGIRYDALG